MFSLAYVILPFSETPPAEAIRHSLTRFQRGGRGDVPEDWLAFHDETSGVRRLHRASFVFTLGNGLRIEGGDDDWRLDARKISAEMKRRGLRTWKVCFATIEPDLDVFAARFLTDLERHPVTEGYGHWLNPLGRWDWWDLGGRFNGHISGERRSGGRPRADISSGPSAGRTVLTNLEEVLGRALGEEPPAEIDVQADENVEMVSRLAEDAEAGLAHAIPGDVVLPAGAIEDRLRWVHSWPEIGPAEAVAWLGLPEGAEWREIVLAAYRRFPDHWAAGVAYHL
jgi:hypothetical protein